MTPTVSVIIPSYNHEKYIRQCIQSVLDQTFQDFEIIITDDGSSDRTVEIIETFTDPRIKIYRNYINKGASVATNNCILNSHGKYIAMLSSDDIWFPEKLEIQVNFLEKHQDISVVFSKVEWIDQDNKLIRGFLPYKQVFNVSNRTRFEWLRHFFLVGNSLCHPSSLIRREKYFEVGLLDPSFASLPDFDLWVRFCLKYDIHILDQPLVYFRRIGETINASGVNVNNLIRNRFENKQILNHFLSIKNPQEFLAIFPEAVDYGNPSPEVIPYLLGRIAINSRADFRMLWGLEIIHTLLKDEMKSQKLDSRFGFTYRDFIKLVGECDVYKISILSIQKDSLIKEPVSTKWLQNFNFLLKKYVKNITLLARGFLLITADFLRNIINL